MFLLTLLLREVWRAQMSIFLQSPLCFRGRQLWIRLSEVFRAVWIWWDSELWHYTYSSCSPWSGQMQNAGVFPWQQHVLSSFFSVYLHGSVVVIPVLWSFVVKWSCDFCCLESSHHGCMTSMPMVLWLIVACQVSPDPPPPEGDAGGPWRAVVSHTSWKTGECPCWCVTRLAAFQEDTNNFYGENSNHRQVSVHGMQDKIALWFVDFK